jgi:hypothetical protein
VDLSSYKVLVFACFVEVGGAAAALREMFASGFLVKGRLMSGLDLRK